MRDKAATTFGIVVLLFLLLGSAGRHDTPLRSTLRLMLACMIVTLVGAWHLSFKWRQRSLVVLAIMGAGSFLLLFAVNALVVGGTAVNGPGSVGGQHYLYHLGQVVPVAPQAYYFIRVLETVMFVSFFAFFAVSWVDLERRHQGSA